MHDNVDIAKDLQETRGVSKMQHLLKDIASVYVYWFSFAIL